MVLHNTGIATKTTTYMKSAGATGTDSIHNTKAPTHLVAAAVRGVVPESGNAATAPHSSNTNIALGNHILALGRRRL